MYGTEPHLLPHPRVPLLYYNTKSPRVTELLLCYSYEEVRNCSNYGTEPMIEFHYYYYIKIHNGN